MADAADGQDWFRLSEAQLSRWFQYRLTPSSRGQHNNVFVAAMSGTAIVGLLSIALDALVARHPMLRARFRERPDGNVEQCITAAWQGVLQQVDADGLDDDALRLRVDADAWQGFADGGPMVRARVYQRGGGNAVFLLSMDHLVCDGWSYWTLLGELRASVEGHSVEPPASAYREYVRWQQDWLQGTAAERAFEYWRGVYAGAPTTLAVPSELDARSGPDLGQRAETLLLDAPLTEALRGLAARGGTTVFGVLAAALQILLHRYGGQDTVLVGAPLPCRSRPAWRRVAGDFVNMIGLRADFNADTTVADVLSGVRAAMRHGVRHQAYPVSALSRRLGPAGSALQASLVFQNAREVGVLADLWDPLRAGQTVDRWGPAVLSAFPIQQRVALDRMLLAVHAIEFEDGIRCDVIHDDGRIDAATVARMATGFRLILAAMVAEGDAAVRSLQLLDGEARAQVLDGFNATAVEYAGPPLLHGWFERTALAMPEAIALRHGEESVTYARLARMTEGIATRLQRAGVTAEDRVAVLLPRGAWLVASILGALKAGAAYVPVDPAYPADRVRMVLHDCGAVAGIGTAALARALATTDMAWLDVADPGIEHEPAPAPPLVGPASLAYVIYTSGSTGVPKGVMIEHASACNLVAWALRDAGTEVLDKVLFATSISFDLAVYEIFVTLAAGGTLDIVRDVLDAPALPVHMVNTVPSGIAGLLHAEAVPSSVRRLNLAGEPLRAALVERVFAQTGVEAVWNLYGPTETTTYSTAVRIGRGDAFSAHIGRPIDNTRVYVLDGAGAPVPIGVVGEIHIAGAGVARGYLGKPELSADRFGPDPFRADGSRCYRTGDLGRWRSDGNLVFLGRSDHQLKIRGFRVEPGEIEAALAQVEDVAGAVVVAHGDDADGCRLVAYVVPRPGRTPSALSLGDALASRLPAHLVPSAFVLLHTLPLTPNGKLDRAALPQPRFESTRAFREPVGEIELRLAAIWRDVLGVQRISRDDSFFEIGGHSLLAMQVAPRLRAAFGVDLPLLELFHAPDLRSVSQRIGLAQEAALSSLPMEAMRSELEGLTEAELMALLEREAAHG